MSGARKRYVVAAIGDSLTDPVVGGGGYLMHVAARCPESTFDNFGIGGEMVNQMLKRFRQAIRDGTSPYSHVIVFGGVNDVYSDLTAGRVPARITRDLGRMYQIARDNRLRVVALTIAPWGGFKRYYNARRGGYTRDVNRFIFEQLEAGHVHHVVDAYSLLSCGDPERLCPELMPPFRDGIHFGKKGHEALGKALHEQVFPDCR